MTNFKATNEMIAAVLAVHKSERLAAMRLAEKTFFSCLRSPNFTEEFSSDLERQEAAGAAAAAEVSYRFA
jgi:hypothetical protein